MPASLDLANPTNFACCTEARTNARHFFATKPDDPLVYDHY
jgi:hypothetical protein